ncbi:MAG: hypothetical protein N3G19_00530 [Candidatus Pacearchaeota archaeon]|nr:hypothetical protein [Candidatus Pacearchaeota archaeon]
MNISKNLLAILLVLVIVVSIFATFSILNTVDRAIIKAASRPVGYGRVSVVVLSPQIDSGTAQVSVNVLPRPGA